MRILFCTHYFPPEVNAPASRTFEHCRAWARAGHKVTVLTCAPNHPNGRLYPGYRNSLFQRQTMDGIEIVRVWTFLAANDGFLLRILNYLSFFVSACIAIAILPKPDIFISTSPQFFCGLTGLFARRVRGFLWLLEIRDLWPESIVAVGAMRRGPLIRLLEWLEVYAYRQADHIVPVTDSFVKHIAERCKDLDKITVVKNGVNLDMFKSDAAAAMELRKALGLEGKFVAAYIGTHGKAHGLETLLAAAERLRDDTEIAFLMVGDGAERERLLKLADERRLKNIHIIGQRPRSEMAAIWGAADASLILLRRKEAFKKVIPSKMFEAMAMARPIILGVEG
ncbi:MAG TPA: glycosyltransferase family 4 protein, partial [Hyphomicrobiales bacterium]|nr:glycosyltransferase family 4 protein [Hyphomicrobiales bacterium]